MAWIISDYSKWKEAQNKRACLRGAEVPDRGAEQTFQSSTEGLFKVPAIQSDTGPEPEPRVVRREHLCSPNVQDAFVTFPSSGKYFQPNYVYTFQDSLLQNYPRVYFKVWTRCDLGTVEACPNRKGPAGPDRQNPAHRYPDVWQRRCVTFTGNFKQASLTASFGLKRGRRDMKGERERGSRNPCERCTMLA